MRSRTRLAICVLSVLCLFCRRGLATTLSDPNYGFTITIPDGFEPDAQLAAKKPTILYAFRKPGKAEPISDPRIIIEHLSGELGPGDVRPQDLPRNFDGSLIAAHWQGIDIHGAEFVENVGGDRIVTYVALVPLQHHALQIWSIGNLDHGDQARALLDQLLASLDGPSSWAATSATAGVATGGHRSMVMIAGAISAILFGFSILVLVRRQSPGGPMLGLALLIYTISFAIKPGRSAELYMLVGCLRFLGFLGFIFGMIDVVRHRKRGGRKTPPPLPPYCEPCMMHHRPGAVFCGQCGVPVQPSAAPIAVGNPALRFALWSVAIVVLMLLPMVYVLNSPPAPNETAQARPLPFSPSSQPIAAVPDPAPLPVPIMPMPAVHRRVVRASVRPRVEHGAHIKTPMCGGRGGGPYLTCSPTDQPVIGFEYETGTWMRQGVIHTLTPIFPGDEGIAISHSVLAKPGYAVGAVEVNGDDYVTAIRIVFMKREGPRLLPADSYTSAWLGTPLDATSYRLTGNGMPVVGIFGNRGLNVDGLGLVVLSGGN
jgi:hypothetical protein